MLAPGGGHVMAVLSNAIYLESFEGYVVGIVGEDAVDGPTSLRVRDLPRLMEPLRGRRDIPFRCDKGVIDLGGLACVSLEPARQWKPRLPERLGAPPGHNEVAWRLGEAIVGCSERQQSGKVGGLTLAELVRYCHSSMHSESNDATGDKTYHL